MTLRSNENEFSWERITVEILELFRDRRKIGENLSHVDLAPAVEGIFGRHGPHREVGRRYV
jgi:hypothetical protein